ncbi:MAG: hypothetical protein HGA65_10480, partial [Oscillochloris sp.]|nr:hypothetical protein [Oscillochloris sp.]
MLRLLLSRSPQIEVSPMSYRAGFLATALALLLLVTVYAIAPQANDLFTSFRNLTGAP